jgi:putative glutamine amidotransferase
MKPVIVLTTNNTSKSVQIEDLIGLPGQEWHLVADDYVREIEEAGGIPLLLPVYRINEDFEDILRIADGFLFTGGRNTDPSYYGQDFSSKITSNNPYRDKMEYALGRKLLFESSHPILGICRGIQILNIAAGGSSYVDLTEVGYDHKFLTAPLYHPTHDVMLTEKSRIRSIMGEDVIRTNSFHSQGVKELGKGMVVAGKTKDGLVEVLEQDSDRFFIAVQFHPEMMAPVHQKFKKIFRSFVDACKVYHQNK